MQRRAFIYLLSVPTLLGAAVPISIDITEVAGIDLTPKAMPPPPVFFGRQDDFLRGSCTGLQAGAGDTVQILGRADKKEWTVTRGLWRPPSMANDRLTQWRIPLGDLVATPQTGSTEICAVVTRPTLPVGQLLGSTKLTAIRAQSPSISISCASFDKSRIRVIEIGGRIVAPSRLLSVSRWEEIKVHCDGVPPKALLQPIVQPMENERRWASPHIEIGFQDEALLTAYFGRGGIGSSVDLDLHQKFWVYVALVTRPLPVRGDGGIEPDEWLQMSQHVRALSPKVQVVRAIVPGVVVRISRMGDSNDGHFWLLNEADRIEGTFEAKPSYVPTGRETITLLVRSVAESHWKVAGATRLTSDRGLWIITAANLVPADGNTRGELRAIAVATNRAFDPSKAVRDEDLTEAQASVSDERRFKLFGPQR